MILCVKLLIILKYKKMMGPQIIDSSKGLLVTLRIISVTITPTLWKYIPYVEAKFNNVTWVSSTNTEGSSRTRWSQNHTFELSEISPLQYRVYYKSGFFKEIELGTCVTKVEGFNSKKGIRVSEILNKEGTKIIIVWSFAIEEDKKNDCEDYLKLINEVEAEREETKYNKNKVKAKLLKIKEKGKQCKEQLRRIMLSMDPMTELYQDKEKLSNDRASIITERKKIDSQASEMLYLKIRIQKEFERLLDSNSSKNDYSRPLKTL